MIILDHDDDLKDESNYNGRTVRHPSVAYTRSSATLPPYEAYSYPPQSQVSLDTASATTTPIRKVKFYRNRRVWKISGIAFAVYIALTLIIALPILVHEGVIYIGSSSGPNYESFSSYQSEGIYLVTPLTGNMSTALLYPTVCNEWSTTGSHFQAATFTVPSSVEAVSIRSNVTRGIIDPLLFNGSLSVSLNTIVDVTDVQYLINITASDAATLKQMNVCFSNVSYAGGLSLYISDTLSAGWLRADVQLILPVTLSNRTSYDVSSASYKPSLSLSTFLPMFQQTFNLPWPTVRRRVDVKIEGASAPINITHLDADTVSIANLLAPVTGNFYVRNSLNIRTTKGSIEGDIVMYEGVFTTLALSGESSPIAATVKFANPSTDSGSDKITRSVQRYRLSAQVTTSNAPLILDIRDVRTSSSAGVDLQVNTRNYFEETRVTIGPTFECNFAASSKLSKINVKDGVTSPQNDPTGANKIRFFRIYKEEANSVEGSVSYKKPQSSASTSTYSEFSKPHIQGGLTLQSTMSPIYLNFAP